MKKFTIEVSHASAGQLTTIAAELKIMSNGWAKHGPQIIINKQQNKFTIEVSHASPGQLTTIGLELKIMSNAWEKFGPRIKINGQQVQAPRLRIEGTSGKLQAASRKRHKLAMFR